MVEQKYGHALAEAWIDAWRRGDFSGIQALLSDDFEHWAPASIEFDRRAKRILRGKSALSRYWAGLQGTVEAVEFKLLSTLTYPNSVAVYYRGSRGRLSAETFHFGPDGKVVKILTLIGDALTLRDVPQKMAA